MSMRKMSAIAGIAAVIGILGSGFVTAPASAAAIESSCDYANPDGGGKFPGSICWFDFSGYDSAAARTTEGQQFEMPLGAYEVSYTVTERSVPGWNFRTTSPAAATIPPFVLGVPGYYDGISGQPFLYANGGTPSAAVAVNITNFQVSLNGVPVTGYDLVAAAPETTDAAVGPFAEYINWTSDVPLTLVDNLPTTTSGGGCALPLAGNATTNVWCNPGAAGNTSAYGSILAAPSATSISGTVYMFTRGEREGLGFGIRTASVSLDKRVASRVDPLDAFNVDIKAGEGATLGSASTGAEESATTNIVPVIPSSPVTLAETPSSGSPSPLDYYDAAWSCTNATPDSTTVLPSGGASSHQLDLVAGDVVNCTVTNTAKTASLALVKSVTPATAQVGDTVVYDFAVTNDGDLPVENLTIDETLFSGTGQLANLSCPVTSLAAAATTTCQASYVATQADIDAGLVTNEAVATARVTGTAANTTSPTSTATLTTGGESALAVTKTSDKKATVVGDDVRYTLTATNTGTLTLHDVALADRDFTGSGALGAITCDKPAPVTLAPGSALTCTVVYKVAQADVGTVTNRAIGTAIDPQNKTIVGEAKAAVTVTAATAAGLAITGGNTPWLAAGLGALLLVAGLVVFFVRLARRSS